MPHKTNQKPLERGLAGIVRGSSLFQLAQSMVSAVTSRGAATTSATGTTLTTALVARNGNATTPHPPRVVPVMARRTATPRGQRRTKWLGPLRTANLGPRWARGYNSDMTDENETITYHVRATDPVTNELTTYVCPGRAMAHAKAAELRMRGCKDVVTSIAKADDTETAT